MGGHFGTSGEPWGATPAPRVHPGGPWEQQDGFEVVNNRIFVDFGIELYYRSLGVLGKQGPADEFILMVWLYCMVCGILNLHRQTFEWDQCLMQ